MNDDEVYQEHILDHYEDPYHRGRCAQSTHAHEDDNPLCGDKVHIDLNVAPDGKIREAWFDGDGCCISQAAASMLVEHVEGKNVEEVKRFTANDMLALFGAKLTPNRQKCCLLSWRVVQGAIFSPTDGSPPEGVEQRNGGRGPRNGDESAAIERSPQAAAIEAAHLRVGGDGPG